jgi:hypothetical protein
VAQAPFTQRPEQQSGSEAQAPPFDEQRAEWLGSTTTSKVLRQAGTTSRTSATQASQT